TAPIGVTKARVRDETGGCWLRSIITGRELGELGRDRVGSQVQLVRDSMGWSCDCEARRVQRTPDTGLQDRVTRHRIDLEPGEIGCLRMVIQGARELDRVPIPGTLDQPSAAPEPGVLVQGLLDH